jgi:hypothetical protein
MFSPVRMAGQTACPEGSLARARKHCLKGKMKIGVVSSEAGISNFRIGIHDLRSGIKPSHKWGGANLGMASEAKALVNKIPECRGWSRDAQRLFMRLLHFRFHKKARRTRKSVGKSILFYVCAYGRMRGRFVAGGTFRGREIQFDL